MKLIQVMIKLIVSMMITSIVCVVCTFTVMNAYIDMVLDQYQLKSSAMTAPSWSQFIAHLGKQAEGFHLFAEGKNDTRSEGTNLNNRTGTTQDTPPNDAIAVFGQQGTDKKTENKVNTGGSAAEAGTGLSKPSAGAVSEASPNSLSSGLKVDGSTDLGSGGKVVVSGEEFTKKKEQLSNEDKNQIFKLLLTRVPQTEIQHISSMMEDGITASELNEIEKILKNYLKPEEYSQLLGMIKP
ncbi:hypothetical protein SAMN03159341_11340 [Paenibacillus sp. 1_12]|uniref:hypothetical protein n=1 Tax=Paenibacillus sp. 1_12 TaxID=1566278 RepID=UPI0008DF76E1|nr:hypothetical protein [Paenibacillus sp. 1_12]SFL97764.1 hypothetical protein SAMN03159341_11340 [Paenibacillus sp. 1_12]